MTVNFKNFFLYEFNQQFSRNIVNEKNLNKALYFQYLFLLVKYSLGGKVLLIDENLRRNEN